MTKPLWRHKWKHYVLSAYLESTGRAYLIYSNRLNKIVSGINTTGVIFVLDSVWGEMEQAEILELMKITSKYGDPSQRIKNVTADELCE